MTRRNDSRQRDVYRERTGRRPGIKGLPVVQSLDEIPRKIPRTDVPAEPSPLREELEGYLAELVSHRRRSQRRDPEHPGPTSADARASMGAARHPWRQALRSPQSHTKPRT